MELYEYQVKQLFKKHGIPVLNGEIAYTPSEARLIAEKINRPQLSLKVQLSHDCKKDGYFLESNQKSDPIEKRQETGIRLINSPQAAAMETAEMLHKSFTSPSLLCPQSIRKVYIEETCDIQKSFSLSLHIDLDQQCILFVLGISGQFFHYSLGNKKPNILFWHQIVRKMNLKKSIGFQCVHIMRQMYEIFSTYSAVAVEINPLVLTSDDQLIALDGRIIFDPDTLYKFPEISALREVLVGYEYQESARQFNFKYTPYKGNIACLTNGSGLGTATVDLVLAKGGAVSCLLDVGTEPNKESVSKAFRLALSEPTVEGIFVNIFGGVIRCDTIAQGLISASHEISIGLPLVVRMVGTNANVGMRLLFESRLPFIVIQSIDEAVDVIVKKVRELS